MTEKQKVLWIQENRNIDRCRIPVEFGKRLVLSDNKLKWQRLRELCYPIQGIGSGLHMIIDSRWSLPITPYKDVIDEAIITTHTNVEELFHDSFNDTKELSEKDRQKAKTADLLLWSLIIVAFGLIFFFFATTKFDLKSWGY